MNYDARLFKAVALLFAIVIIGVGGDRTAADAPKASVPDDVYSDLVDQAIKAIRESIQAPDGKARRKAESAAFLLAAYAQDNLEGENGPQRATVRDRALAAFRLMRSQRFEVALCELADLPNVHVDPQAKLVRLPLTKELSCLSDLAGLLGSPKHGGLGIERHFCELESKGRKEGQLPQNALDDKLLLMAYQLAVIGDLEAEFEADLKVQNLKEWRQYMKTVSLQLAEVTRKKDGKAAFTELSKLNAGCADCHRAVRFPPLPAPPPP